MKQSTLILTIAAFAACARLPVAGGDVATVTPANARTLPVGSSLQTTLDGPLGTEINHVGDEFTATVSHSLIARNGAVVVPDGAVIYGHITGLHAGGAGERSVIRLDFDKLTFGGNTYPFKANVSGVMVKNRNKKHEAAGKIATGAAVGGALGTIISGAELKRLVTGGLLGAGAGTVISLGTGDVESTLPARSELTLTSTKTIKFR